MSTEVDQHISSQTVNAYESRAGVRLKRWKAAAAKGPIAHPLRWTSGMGVRGLSNPAAQQSQGHIAAPRPQHMAVLILNSRPPIGSSVVFADGYELVAFDLPAANGYPAMIGWELFGGPNSMTLVASSRAASLKEAKTPARRRWFRRWWLSDVRRRLKP
jgi:hypothetical protein